FLKLFSKEEFKKFGLFVCSPYFNRLNNVTRFYNILKNYHPDYKSKKLTRENIFKKIFPGQKYVDIRLRTLFSYLFFLAEKFLAMEYYSSSRINLSLDAINSLL